jgi:hypothetical protein
MGQNERFCSYQSHNLSPMPQEMMPKPWMEKALVFLFPRGEFFVEFSV